MLLIGVAAASDLNIYIAVLKLVLIIAAHYVIFRGIVLKVIFACVIFGNCRSSR